MYQVCLMTNGSWLIGWSTFSLLAISLGDLPVVASEVSSVIQQVAQATPSLVVNRPILRTGSQGAEVSELQAALKLLGYFTGAVDGFYGESTAIAVSRFQQASGLKPDGVTGPTTWARLFPSTPQAQTPSPTPSPNSASGFPIPSTIQTTTSDRRPNAQRSTPANVSRAGKTPNSTPTANQPTRRSSGNRSTTNAANSPTALKPQPTAVALPILRQGMQGPAIAHLQERLRALGFFKGSVDGVFGTATQTAVKTAQQSFKLTPDGIVGAATWSALLR